MENFIFILLIRIRCWFNLHELKRVSQHFNQKCQSIWTENMYMRDIISIKNANLYGQEITCTWMRAWLRLHVTSSNWNWLIKSQSNTNRDTQLCVYNLSLCVVIRPNHDTVANWTRETYYKWLLPRLGSDCGKLHSTKPNLYAHNWNTVGNGLWCKQ